MNKMVHAEWTGEYPTLCYGEWKLIVNGIDVSDKIPRNLRHNEMSTFGYYNNWEFDSDWMEEWWSYTNGHMMDEWIKLNKYWLDTISTDRDTQEMMYLAIQQNDWRYNSCGGCI